MFALCYGTVVLSILSVCNVGVAYCGQTVGWIKMPLGTEVGLGPSDILLDGDLLTYFPHGQGHSSQPLFGPCLL